MERPCVEIEVKGKRRKATYRFYGLGEWKVNFGECWEPIDAIFVPADALRIAASQCHPTPPPFLSELDIARLCGGNV
jgi:hypothetical protein